MTEQNITLEEVKLLKKDLVTVIEIFIAERKPHPNVTAALLAAVTAEFIYAGSESLSDFDENLTNTFNMAMLAVHQNVTPAPGAGH